MIYTSVESSANTSTYYEQRQYLPYTIEHANGVVDEDGAGVVDGVLETEERAVGVVDDDEVFAHGVDIDEA